MKQRIIFAAIAVLAAIAFFLTSYAPSQFQDLTLLFSVLAFVGSVGMAAA